jgi:hypothetical protein
MSASETQQECAPNITAKEHEWLQKLVGEWTYESKRRWARINPGGSRGTERTLAREALDVG